MLETQWVSSPIRQRLATSRNRVLRSREKERPSRVDDWAESRMRSVDSECVCRVIEPRNLTSRESLSSWAGGLAVLERRMAWRDGLSGVRERGAHTRVSQERERSCRCPSPAGWEPIHQEMGVRLGGRKSEHSIVPTKRGNPPQGDPVEGRGMSGGSSKGCPRHQWARRAWGLSPPESHAQAC